MSIDQWINLLVTITLAEMMAAIGLGVTFTDLLGVVGNGRLIAQAALANYVVVPAVTVGLLLLFQAQPMVAAGFLILAACPGAPFGPPLTSIARGNTAVSVGLMVILAGSSAILAPIILYFLLPLMAGSEHMQVDPVKIVVTLLAVLHTQVEESIGFAVPLPVLAWQLFFLLVLPVLTGMFIRRRWPDVARRFGHTYNL